MHDKTEFKVKVYKERLNMKYESRLKELDEKMKEIDEDNPIFFDAIRLT